MDNIREVPERVLEWMKDSMMKAPIYYHNNKSYADCTCGRCCNEFQVWFRDESYLDHLRANIKPQRGGRAECPLCGLKTEYEWKRVIRATYEQKEFLYIDLTTEGDAVIRSFKIFKQVQQGVMEKVEITEHHRYICKPGAPETWYSASYFDYRINKWESYWKKATKANYSGDICAELYPIYYEMLAKSSVPYFKPSEYAIKLKYRSSGSNICQTLFTYASCPSVEMFNKAGFDELTRHLIEKCGHSSLINKRGKSMKAQLRLKNSENIRTLREAKGDIHMLQLLQEEEKKRFKRTKEEREWIVNNWMRKDAIDECLKYMSMRQLLNRLEAYAKQRKISETYVLHEYADYLRIRESLEYDMTNEIYIHPRDLKDAHDKVVAEKRSKEDEQYITKKNEQFCKIPERFKSLTKKYGYTAAGLTILIPRTAGDIIMEGRRMHHCVGSGDNYLRKHDEGRTSILFLRKADSPDEPYVTIEIEGSQIRQWFEAYDKKDHADTIDPWLSGYINHLEGDKKCS